MGRHWSLSARLPKGGAENRWLSGKGSMSDINNRLAEDRRLRSGVPLPHCPREFLTLLFPLGSVSLFHHV